MVLKAKMVMEMSKAGKISRHGAVAKASFPSEAMVPQLAMGWVTPKPR